MYEYRIHEVDRVVDGDTIDVTIDLGFDILYKTRVRLYGINTPETRTKDLEEKEKGLAAKQRMNEIINHAQHMGHHLILQTKEKGKFGRYLGIIIIEDCRPDHDTRTNINQLLVEEGHAVPYDGGKR
jgi:endonuclease YncB( thermonuclease family)